MSFGGLSSSHCHTTPGFRFSPTSRFSFWFLSNLPTRAQMSTSSDEEVFVCFEGKVHAEQKDVSGRFYEQMSKLVKTQPGFISETPFKSIDQDGGQLLYVRFDNEQHLHDWKNNHIHLGIQAKGRADIFVDYRLRVGNEVLSGQSPCLGNSTTSAGKYLLMWQYPTPSNTTRDGLATCVSGVAPDFDPQVWQGLVDAGTYIGETYTLRISSWPSEDVGLMVKAAVPRIDGDDLRLIRVERDYGRFQRKEAPGDADRCQKAAATNDTESLQRC